MRRPRRMPNPPAAQAAAEDKRGSIGKFRDWWQLRQKQQALEAARFAAQQKAQALSASDIQR